MLILSILFAGCQTAIPSIMVYYISDTVDQYYFPSTTWKSEKKQVMIRLDSTYRAEPGRDVVCNISFINKDITPQEVSSLLIIADERVYPLEDVKELFVDQHTHILRVTSHISPEQFYAVCTATAIKVSAVLDGLFYDFFPPRQFFIYKDQYGEYRSP